MNFSVRIARPSTRGLLEVRRRPSARTMLGAGAAVALGATVTACGTGSAHAVSKQAVTLTCQKVSAVLSAGPDATVDPVGYALAQVNPLRQIRAAHRQLATAIDHLADAYQRVYASNNSTPARQAAAKASASVNRLCPGAAT